MTTTTKINWRNDSQKISEFFTVGEVTQSDSRRIPASGSQEERNILNLAIELDRVRRAWGGPITITSWYRPAAVNAEVGGATYSQHVRGNAADIRPANPADLPRFQAWLDENWYGALGYGARKGFVHVDIRNAKGWKTGGAKGVRWNY